VGFVVLAVGVLIVAGTAVWLKMVRTTVADSPISFRAGTIRQEFTVDHDGIYVMSVRFNQNISRAKAACFLGGQELDQSLDCKDSPPLLKFSWQIFGDGQIGSNGTSAVTGSGPMNDVTIFGFPAQKNHHYVVALTFQRDASELQIPPPRVRVELSGFGKEDFFLAAAALDSVGLGLCVIGGTMILVSFLRAKFKRFGTRPTVLPG
jgi:hypothetical protein